MIKKTITICCVTGLLSSYAFCDDFQVSFHDKEKDGRVVYRLFPEINYPDYVKFDLKRQSDHDATVYTNLPNDLTGYVTFFAVAGDPSMWAPFGTSYAQNGRLYTVDGDSLAATYSLWALYNTTGVAHEKFYNYEGNLVGEFTITMNDKDNYTTIVPETIISNGEKVPNNCIAKEFTKNVSSGSTVPYCNFPDGVAKVDITTSILEK